MMGVTTLDDLARTYERQDVLFVEDVARALALSVATLRSMVSKGQGPKPLARPRKDSQGRYRRAWRRADVAAYRDGPKGMHGRAVQLHARLAHLDTVSEGLRTTADIGREVGVSARTVSRHLRGECGCKSS